MMDVMSNTATAAQPHTDPKEDFGWTLGVLVRNYQNASTAAMGAFPHGARGYQVLVAVASGEQPNQLALAQHLGIDRTVMTYLVDDFVKAGLVERRLNPADRRARMVVATEAGLAMLAELAAQRGRGRGSCPGRARRWRTCRVPGIAAPHCLRHSGQFQRMTWVPAKPSSRCWAPGTNCRQVLRLSGVSGPSGPQVPGGAECGAGVEAALDEALGERPVLLLDPFNQGVHAQAAQFIRR